MQTGDKMLNDHIVQAGAATKVAYNLTIAGFAWACAYLNIDQEAIALYTTLLMIDLATGTMASFIAREQVTKARFVAGFMSKLLMFVVPVVIAIVAKVQGGELDWFIKWTVIVLSVSEAISIFNNLLKSKGQKPLPDMDAIAIIAGKLRELLEKLFKQGGV